MTFDEKVQQTKIFLEENIFFIEDGQINCEPMECYNCPFNIDEDDDEEEYSCMIADRTINKSIAALFPEYAI